MSGERVDGIHPHVLKVELDLFSGGFDPYVAGEQDGFWVELTEGTTVAVWWLTMDFAERVGDGPRWRFEDRDMGNRMLKAYAHHLREVAEIEARTAYQKPRDQYKDLD